MAKRKTITQLSDLTPDTANANRGTERGRFMVEASLTETGAGRSIVADKDGRIIAGNKTLEAWAAMGGAVKIVETDGQELVVVQRTDLDLSDPKGKARKLAYYDNRAGQVGLEWDAEQLLADVNAGVDLAAMFKADEIAELLAGVKGGEADAEPQIDQAEELNKKWQVKTGDLWRIGAHRLLCGDSTKAADVARVMGGEKARIVFTSPPYADQREYEIGKFDWLALMNGVSDSLFSIIGKPADVLVNLGMSYKDGRANLYWDDWLKHCESLGHPLYGWYVWDKGRGFPGEWNGRLAPAHEFIFHFSAGRASANHWVEKAESSFARNKYAKNAIQRKADGAYKKPTNLEAMEQPYKIPDSVVRMPQDTEGYGNHPAIYPVGFPAFGLQTWSVAGDVAFEPFAGSGTTLVACENLGRKCRAVEISPAYCAVILERMAQAFPKLEITRDDGAG